MVLDKDSAFKKKKLYLLNIFCAPLSYFSWLGLKSHLIFRTVRHCCHTDILVMLILPEPHCLAHTTWGRRAYSDSVLEVSVVGLQASNGKQHSGRTHPWGRVLKSGWPGTRRRGGAEVEGALPGPASSVRLHLALNSFVGLPTSSVLLRGPVTVQKPGEEEEGWWLASF